VISQYIFPNDEGKMKDVKAQLKEHTDKKKEAGKVPRNNQAASNKFNVPILTIAAGSALTPTSTQQRGG